MIQATSLLTRVRRSRLARTMKGVSRDLWWGLKAFRLRNPPLARPIDSVLFVCLGNICRSPYAEKAGQTIFEEAGLSGVRCVSAGLRAKEGVSPPSEAVDAAARRGRDLSAHRARPTTRELLEDFDLVVVMEASQLEQLRAEHPTHAERVVLLPLYAERRGCRRANVADPFGRPRAAFDACYEEIDECLWGLSHALADGERLVRIAGQDAEVSRRLG